MAILDDLIGKPGTLAVGGFGPDGQLVDFHPPSGAPAAIGPMASQFAATVEMLMGTFGATFSELTGLAMVPFYGWVYSGGEMTSVIQARRFALLRTADSEFRCDAGGDGPLLADLLTRPGVRLAAYYAPDGKEIAHAQSIELERDVRRTLTEIVGSCSTTFRGLATAFSHLTKTPWSPPRVWVYSGGDWSIAASDCCWVLGEAGEAGVLDLHHALMR
jgi:roadblock/LC7 domain-containing protein